MLRFSDTVIHFAYLRHLSFRAKPLFNRLSFSVVMSKLSRSDLKRYGVAVVCVFFATVITLIVQPLFGGKAPLFFFTVAVIVSAAYGLGPGLVATLLSVGSVLLFFRQIFTIVMAHSSLTLFALIGVGISLVMGRLHKTNTALLRTREELQRANDRLEERGRALSRANEELQRFAYVLAHDLNAPARVICALTDLLLERNSANMDESSKECAGLIVDKARRMQGMIKGLLDYAGVVEKPAEQNVVDIGFVVQRALLDVDALIHARGAEITIERPLPFVEGVESQLVQVFSNLLSNGIKYCPRGREPRIHISAVEQNDEFVFRVRDNGIGLEMQYADTIFGMFKRLHGDEYEGSGIGLALCKAVVERHGGRIWVESQPDQGASFYFTLPKSRSASTSEAVHSSVGSARAERVGASRT